MTSVYGTVAGIDVHKKWLYVVIAPEEGSPSQWERLRTGSTATELSALAERLERAGVRTVVMESTAQYWRPVWAALEERFQLRLAQAQSNAAPHGRKTDYGDATRLIKRLRAEDLRLSFVPGAEQRGCRLLTRTRVHYREDLTRLRNRLEGLLEECRIKISGVLSDLLGASGRRMLRALANGQTDPQQLAALGDDKLRASREELAQALEGRLTPVHRLLIRQCLDQIEALEDQIADLDKTLEQVQGPHQSVLGRLCAIPGVAVAAAREILAELGPTAQTFPTAGHAASWIGVCPGRRESAGYSRSDACAKGNRYMRRVLNQCAWAAVRTKGSYFENLFRRLVPRLGVSKAIWAVAHRMLRLIWAILHKGIEYQDRGPLARDAAHLKRMLERNIRALRKLGIDIQLTVTAAGATG